jgi:hypothetical protein
VWFHLHGHVSAQSNQYWSPVNSHLIHEVPLHDIKVGVWYTMNAKQIIGPIFYTEIINSDRHVRLILTKFFTRLTAENNHTRGFNRIQQLPTPQTILGHLWKGCLVTIISHGLWPACSPDCTPCNFYLRGNLKDKVYRTKPHTEEE